MKERKVIITILLSFLILHLSAQGIKEAELDSLSLLIFYQNNSDFRTSKSLKTYFYENDKLVLKFGKTAVINFDYLKHYEYKSYKMSEYYIHHRLNTTPHILKINYPLPPHTETQRIEIVKKKK